MHSSWIEHFVITAKLMDLNELELIGVTQWTAYCQYACSSHTNNRDSSGLREICSLGAGQDMI
jgi:hypothetical protein